MINMSKLSDLSKLVNMRLPSIEIPDDWEQDLRQAALKAGARSITAYLQTLIAKDLGKEPVLKAWGGKRQVKQDEQVTQDAHVEQDDASTTKPEPPKSVAATPIPPESQSIIQMLNPVLEKVAEEQAKIEQKTINTTAQKDLTPAERLAANRAAAKQKYDRSH